MSTTTLTPAKIAGIRRSNAYKALIAEGKSPAKALKRLTRDQTPKADPNAAKIAALVATGEFTQAEAVQIVAAQHFTPTAVAKATKETSSDTADRLVAEAGLAHARGRVYVSPTIIEATVRVSKGGSPEVVATSGVGRTTHVVVFRTEGGDVALQNCYRPV